MNSSERRWIKRSVRSNSNRLTLSGLKKIAKTLLGALLLSGLLYGIHVYTYFDSHDSLLRQQIAEANMDLPSLEVQLTTNGDIDVTASHDQHVYVSIFLNESKLAQHNTIAGQNTYSDNKRVLRFTQTLPSHRLGIHTLRVVAEPQSRPDKRVSKVLVYNLTSNGLVILSNR